MPTPLEVPISAAPVCGTTTESVRSAGEALASAALAGGWAEAMTARLGRRPRVRFWVDADAPAPSRELVRAIEAAMARSDRLELLPMPSDPPSDDIPPGSELPADLVAGVRMHEGRESLDALSPPPATVQRASLWIFESVACTVAWVGSQLVSVCAAPSSHDAACILDETVARRLVVGLANAFLKSPEFLTWAARFDASPVIKTHPPWQAGSALDEVLTTSGSTIVLSPLKLLVYPEHEFWMSGRVEHNPSFAVGRWPSGDGSLFVRFSETTAAGPDGGNSILTARLLFTTPTAQKVLELVRQERVSCTGALEPFEVK